MSAGAITDIPSKFSANANTASAGGSGGSGSPGHQRAAANHHQPLHLQHSRGNNVSQPQHHPIKLNGSMMAPLGPQPTTNTKQQLLNDAKWERAVKITSTLCVDDKDYEKVDALLLDEMLAGLAQQTNKNAVLKMLPTYVHDVPDGTERGQFLALDLGGTNFRVLAIDLKPDRKFEMRSKIFAVPQDVMTSTGERLFDHIAECIARFMEQEGLKQKILPLGFTFSFPCVQTGLTSSSLIRWTKGFNASNVEGQDVVKLLLDAVKRRDDYDIEVVAVVNDTTGTLMSCAFQEPTCAMGLIVGTGTNACYIERLDLVELWRASADDIERTKNAANMEKGGGAGADETDFSRAPANGQQYTPWKQIMVNMEWGAFGDNGRLDFIRTEFDRDIDEHSINPGMQVFEKMISGMYMGELVRLVLVKLAKEGALFDGAVPDALLERNSFFTKYVSEIESDPPYNNGGSNNVELSRCRSVLEDELGINNATELDRRIVRLACESVSSRAGYLCGTAVATVLNHMGRERATVAVDGSVYKYHPRFHDLMEEQCKKFLHKGLSFKLMLSEDGSGKGAALVAAVAMRLAKRSKQPYPLHEEIAANNAKDEGEHREKKISASDILCEPSCLAGVGLAPTRKADVS